MGPREGLGVLEDTNPLPLLEIEPRIVQPVAKSAHRLQKLIFLQQYRHRTYAVTDTNLQGRLIPVACRSAAARLLRLRVRIPLGA